MSSIVIAGDTSGSVTLQAPAVAGSTTLTLPATSGTVVLTGGAGAFTSVTASTTLGVTGVSTFSAGTAALPALTTTGDTNTGIFFPTADTLAFSEGGAEAMRIDSNGYLLLGLTASSTAAYQQVKYTTAIQGARYINTSSTSSDVIDFVANSAQVGRINTSGSSTSYVTSSDYRLKENIAQMTGALSLVAQLKPVTYKWKSDNTDGQGFIAHELQAIVPDAVVGAKDAINEDGSINPQGIDTSFLVATLTAAIQEQQALITTLTERITALEGA